MEFEFDAKQILSALSSLKPMAEKGGSELNSVLLSVKDSELSLSVTDKVVTPIVKLKVVSKGDFTTLIPLEKLHAVLSQCNDKVRLVYSEKDSSITIINNKNKSKISCYDPEIFPTRKNDITVSSFNIAINVLRNHIDYVIHCADDTYGIHFVLSATDGTITTAATDRFRIAIHSSQYVPSSNMSFTLFANNLVNAVALFQKFGVTDVAVDVNPNNIQIFSNNVEVSISVKGDSYPDVFGVLGNRPKLVATFKTSEFIKNLSFATVFNKDSVSLSVKNGIMTLLVTDAINGDTVSVFDVQQAGDDFSIDLNGKSLQQQLDKLSHSDKIDMYYEIGNASFFVPSGVNFPVGIISPSG